MSFEKKYLQYKKKYLKLKKIIGGDRLEVAKATTNGCLLNKNLNEEQKENIIMNEYNRLDNDILKTEFINYFIDLIYQKIYNRVVTNNIRNNLYILLNKIRINLNININVLRNYIISKTNHLKRSPIFNNQYRELMTDLDTFFLDISD